MKIAIDFEFTGLSLKDIPISFAAVSDNGKELYIEFTDWKDVTVSEWIQNNVVKYLWSILPFSEVPEHKGLTYKYTDFESAKPTIKNWFNQFGSEKITIIVDVGHYDWVWFCEIFGGALNLPDYIEVVPVDFNSVISRLQYISEVDAFDVPRQKLAGPDGMKYTQHNALDDANMLMLAYRRYTE